MPRKSSAATAGNVRVTPISEGRQRKSKREKVAAPLLPPPPTREEAIPASGGGTVTSASWALRRASEDYTFQSTHPGNRSVDFMPLWERLAKFHETFKEKGLLKSRRDRAFDWAGFQDDVETFRDDLFSAVLDHMIARATRMITTSGGQFTQDEIGEMWGEAQEHADVRSQVKGFSALITKLRALGCTDSEEHHTGHRQTGGNRRRR